MRMIDADMLADWVLCNLHDQCFDALTGRQAANLIGKAIDESPTVYEWVSVKDRMPETCHAVLVYTPHYKNIWAAVMHEDRNWYIWSPGNRVLLDPDWYGPITHWMPLPKPPKKGA